MQVKPGYKQTEVGVIPRDWEMKRIGDVATVSAGGTPSRANPAYWNGHIPWITTGQIDFNKIDDAEQFITEEGLRQSAAVVLPAGTLLMALYGQGKTRGKTATLGVDAATNQACAAITLNRGISHEYVFHYLASQYEAIRKLSNTGNQENLNGGLVRSIPLAVPIDAREQEAIAEALSDADALIESLEQLIAKKRHLKQGAMQELLTGKKRLPGFSEAWKMRPLGEVAPLQRGFDLPTSRLREGPYPVAYSNGVLNHHIEFQVKGPGVVTGRSGTIGTVTYIEQDFWPHNTSLWVTSFKRNDPRFVFYLYARIGLERFATGSGVPTLNRNDVHAFKVNTPATNAEQTAIAAILSDIDAAIAATEAKLAKARHLKQGMMQELLTGRIRLV